MLWLLLRYGCMAVSGYGPIKSASSTSEENEGHVEAPSGSICEPEDRLGQPMWVDVSTFAERFCPTIETVTVSYAKQRTYVLTCFAQGNLGILGNRGRRVLEQQCFLHWSGTGCNIAPLLQASPRLTRKRLFIRQGFCRLPLASLSPSSLWRAPVAAFLGVDQRRGTYIT
jgi:hypothetical protein